MLTPRVTERDLTTAGDGIDVPTSIADHVLLRCIGEGSYGRVYLGQNQLTGVFRAVKIVFRNAFKDSRPYLREFDAICSFEPVSRSHQGFVQILHVGKLENAFYYIMELADDVQLGPVVQPETYSPRTLSLNRGEMLPIERCVEIGSCLADCLAVLHEQKLIHRDIKPSNIIFVKGRPKLADIGLVTQIEEAKSFVGTAGFMPPEGPTTPASDIYSLGKVLYEIATGKDRCEFPQLPSDITGDNALDLELNQIVLRACHPDAAKRYSSAHDLRRELDLLQAGKSIKRLRQVERRFRILKLSFIASLLLGIGAFTIYYQVKSRREQAERERQRLAGYLLAEGTSKMRNGYLSHALPFFLRAAEYDPSDMTSHRLRIGSVFSHAPNRALRWTSPSGGNFSADGKWLVAPQGSNLIIFDSASGKAIKTNVLDGKIDFARFSPDRKQIAACMGPVLALLATDGQKTFEHTFDATISDVAFSPRDGALAVALNDGSGMFLDPASGLTRDFPGDETVRNVSFDRAGERLLATDVNNHFSRIRNGRTGEILSRRLDTEIPYGGVFSRDGSVVVICGWASAIPFIAATGERAGDSMPDDDAVMSAAFSPGDELVATANYDGTVRLWNGHTFQPLLINHILEHDSRPERIAFIDENTLVTHCIDGSNYVWNLGTKPPAAEPIPHTDRPDPLHVQMNGIDLSAQGKSIIGTIGNREIHVAFPNPVNVLAASPRGDAFAAGSKDQKFEITYAMLYPVDHLDSPIRLNHKDGINHIAFSHSGARLVTCSEDFSAIIWNTADGKRLTQPMRHRWQVMWAAFSSDDRWLVTAGSDQVCIVWNASNGEPLTTPLTFPGSLYYVAFEPDDRGIIASTKRGDYRMNLPFADLPLQDQSKYLQNWIEPTILTHY